MVANKTSKCVWAYQSAVGTAELVIATSDSYEFGMYNLACGEWKTPMVNNPSNPYYSYDSRTPLSTDGESTFPTWKHTFNPTTAQFLAWFLGKPVDNDPTTVEIEALDTGLTCPITFRVQEDGATVPDNAQGMDAYCIGLAMTMEKDKSFIVECEFVFGALQDIDNYVNLTKDPVMPGDLLTGRYRGNPIVVWDAGVDNHALAGTWKAQVVVSQEFEVVASDEGATQTVYTYKFLKPKIVLYSVVATAAEHELWKDYIARKINTDMTIQVKKSDNTSYITFTFSKCRITSMEKTGAKNEGHYGVITTIEADSIIGSADWHTEGGITYATHWRDSV